MERAEVIILGGGLVGLTLAIALDTHGISSCVIDPADPQAHMAPGFDGRASAIASAPWRMLQAIGVGEFLQDKGCPIARIAVRDGLTRDALWFDSTDDGEALGQMFENRAIRQALAERTKKASHITLLAPATPAQTHRDADGVRVTLADGRVVEGALLIGAEGRRSPTRDQANMRVARWSYDHIAMIASIEHEKSHENVAHEIFYSDGPFAILPLQPGNRSCVVWSVRRKDGAAMMGLPDAVFIEEMTKKMDGMLGKLTLLSPRSSYPLDFHHAARIVDQRLALVGDAAHGIHPIAGQGVNVGYRDVAALVEILVQGARLGMDLGDQQLLNRYDRWRSLDTLSVATATDVLTRLFGMPGPLARTARRFGLRTVERLPVVKKWFMAEARGSRVLAEAAAGAYGLIAR